MHRKEINERSPMRVLEQSIHGGLGRGNLGVVVARHGVGKTAFLVGVALDVSGFTPNVAQSAATTWVMRVLLGLVPCAVLVAAIALMFGYRLDEREHAAIRARVTQRRAPPLMDRTP